MSRLHEAREPSQKKTRESYWGKKRVKNIDSPVDPSGIPSQTYEQICNLSY